LSVGFCDSFYEKRVSEYTAINSLNSFTQLILIIETRCVPREVGNGFLNNIYKKLVLKRVKSNKLIIRKPRTKGNF
jgi:hypothetical protein